MMAWNVKSSFRSYIEAAGGTIELAEGAVDRDDVFGFPAAHESEPGLSRFTGSVRFTAHGGALDLLIRDPWIHVDAAGSRPDIVRLSIAGTEATRTAGGRLFLAALSALPTGDGIPPRLLPEGAVAFDFRYPPGTELAPLRLLSPEPALSTPRSPEIVKGD